MKAPNKIDIIPETLQKEFHDFISNNATFLFGTTDNHYEHVVKLKDLYMGKAKNYKELVKSYQSQFLNLLLADNFDKIAVAKLFQDMTMLALEQNRDFEKCGDALFDNYSELSSDCQQFLMVMSKDGIDFGVIDEE